jgi:O-antigen/teichoic acid export membrane protein
LLNSPQQSSEKRKIIKGISWLLLLSWSNRLLGFFSIIVLARILSPEDFGVMAIIVMALQLTDTLTNLGSEQYYIQKNDADQADLNCAWSMNLLLKLSTSLCFAVIAPLVAKYLDYDEIIPALITIAFLPSISALSNGTFYRYKKELNYQTFVTLSATAKLLGNCLAIVFALVLQNYWALLIGAMVNAIVFLLGSYLFLPEKCNFELTQWRSQLQFSKWVILKNFIGHIRAKIDSWFTAHLYGVTTLGGYNFSKDLVLLPSRELLSPISDVFFTSIAKTNTASSEQNLKIKKSLTIIFSLAFPIAFG